MEIPGAPVGRTLHSIPTDDDIDAYRLLSSDMAAGVGVVSTRWRGRDYAATISGFLSVSWDPPTILVSLYGESRIGEAASQAGSWALSLLTAGQRGTANWLASPGTPLEGLLSNVPFQRGPNTGAPIVAGCLAWFESMTTAVHPAATHLLVVGEVTSMGRDVPGTQADDPLVHFAGDYRRLASS